MSELEPPLGPARLTERQARIADRLDELSETLGDLFRAAVREAQERRGKAWIRLAAHACRELVIKLPDYLDIPVAGRRLDYALRFREIAERWPENLEDEPPVEVIELVVGLVKDDRATSASIRARAETFFAALESGDEFYSGEAAARAVLWVELQRYFPSVAHVPAPDVADPDAALFDRYFVRLERLLASQFRSEGYYETQSGPRSALGGRGARCRRSGGGRRAFARGAVPQLL
jgi:hypothetical protein